MGLRESIGLVSEHFDGFAEEYDSWKNKNKYYSDNIKRFLKKNICSNSRVLEIGCATGEMLASVEPSHGVGIDISSKLIDIASKKYPQYKFINQAVEDFETEEKFDYIIITDVIHHVYDVMSIFEQVHKVSHPRTKVIITVINPWWEPLLKLAEKFKAKIPEMPLNYFDRRNIKGVLELVDFSVNQMGCLLLCPKKIPIISYLANTIGVRFWGLNKLSFVQYMIVQPARKNDIDLGFGCSVIIPCHNEEGNIVDGIRRIPSMGKGTEIIVVNDGSTDRTSELVVELQKEYDNLKLIECASNEGKGKAVQRGFDAACEEVIMILDADLTVEPEELPRFFDPLNKGMCDFANGTRLVYPKENQSMRFLNHLGNKGFSLVMTFLVNQPLSDTLCGTKALYKKDYKNIKMGLDTWGDFDLLFGAAKIGSKILEIPVHYKSRTAGVSKMRSFHHGLHLLNACLRGFYELVFMVGKK